MNVLKSMSYLVVTLLFSIYSIGQQSKANPLANKEGVYNDLAIKDYVNNQCMKMFNNGNFTELDTLLNTIGETSDNTLFKKPKQPFKNFNYQNSSEGVLILTKLYLCGECPNHHTTSASGFVISKEGLCVSNIHVFSENINSKSKGIGMFATDRHGKTYPVTEILSTNKTKDLAVFKIKTDTALKPLPIKISNAKVGDIVNIISHPFNEFYTYSTGEITRFYVRNNRFRASISADFAQGSSGAPVMNSKGEVVGIVASTHALNAKTDNQMVVKSIIPISELYNMIPNYNK